MQLLSLSSVIDERKYVSTLRKAKKDLSDVAEATGIVKYNLKKNITKFK